MVVLVFIAFIALCIIISALIHIFKRKTSESFNSASVTSGIFNESSVLIPKGVYFDKTHTWAFMEKNGDVKIGIDDFLLHITGPITRIMLKNAGEEIEKGEPLLTIIQNGKQLNVYSPISGIVKFQNSLIVNDPSIINSSPFNEGWIYAVESSNWLRDIKFMIMSDIYKEWLRNEFTRLKDFFAATRQSFKSELLPVILQDGGELKNNLLADFSPEVWEEFQLKFLNKSKFFTIENILTHFNRNSEY